MNFTPKEDKDCENFMKKLIKKHLLDKWSVIHKAGLWHTAWNDSTAYYVGVTENKK